ncbi:MAG: hypothetical protein GEU82_01040 [Luteitalea sp.]|nr:hypothetical protein [Luteitalea sp.]
MSKVEGSVCTVVCLTLGMLVSSVNPVAAQERDDSPSLLAVASPNAVVGTAPLRPSPAARPSGLVPLYVSFGVLQALDMHSTHRALTAGGSEGNPVVSALQSPLAMGALKVGATAGIIVLTEKLRKNNRIAAIVTMVALNSGYAMIVSHNYSIAR